MKFSEAWLREWVSPDVTTEELAHRLTMAGLEVDAIEPVTAEFTNVIVGEVIKLAPHPDADRLRVCQVNVNAEEPLQIVCGAANVAEGMKVPTAMIGAVLPGDFKIKKSKLRGVLSMGMLCSAKELGLAEEAEGLLPLPADAIPGMNVRELLQLDDVSIELGLTPNRSDCLGIAGIARETGVLFGIQPVPLDVQKVPVAIEDTFEITLNAPDACPRYLGRVIRDINQDAETPLWMQEKLRRSGLRSISPVVDVTNYVLLELGQPMHAFDLDKLHGAIDVRYAKAGEELALLDGQTVSLQDGTLVIADDQQALAIAGVMGGEPSSVSDTTQHLFLECAFFMPTSIAGHARRYGLHTDSSHRFERGVDPEIQALAMERATALLLDIVGGEAGPVVEQVSTEHLPQEQTLTLRQNRIQQVLGMEIAPDEISETLKRLGMQVSTSEAGWQVTSPLFRFDIALEADLIEEVGRIHGYDQLPTHRPTTQLEMTALPESRISLGRIQDLLVDRGYQEAITYSFVDQSMQAIFSPGVDVVKLANPIASDLSVMRTSLWPGLLQALQYNLNRQQGRAQLFECGLKYLPQDNEIIEEKYLAGVISGTKFPEQWSEKSAGFDFYDAKADVEALFNLAGILSEIQFKTATYDGLHPGQTAAIWHQGRCVGAMGALHPQVQEILNLPGSVYVYEIQLDILQTGHLPAFQPISKYPSIRRDIAIVVEENVAAADIQACIVEETGNLLTNLQLFDVYSGKGVDSGRKSVALGLTLQDSSRTLIDADVDSLMQRLMTTLNNKLGATLRD